MLPVHFVRTVRTQGRIENYLLMQRFRPEEAVISYAKCRLENITKTAKHHFCKNIAALFKQYIITIPLKCKIMKIPWSTGINERHSLLTYPVIPWAMPCGQTNWLCSDSSLQPLYIYSGLCILRQTYQLEKHGLKLNTMLAWKDVDIENLTLIDVTWVVLKQREVEVLHSTVVTVHRYNCNQTKL